MFLSETENFIFRTLISEREREREREREDNPASHEIRSNASVASYPTVTQTSARGP